jgi:hypothetical protein
MSITSLFALILLVFLLGMVMNSGRQADQKVKMQNAADAATFSGGVVLTRSMNTLAFTNHLLCDVFALTAFLREAEAGNAASMTPEILDNWDRVAPAFAGSEFERFARLGEAIPDKVRYERQMVETYSIWVQASAELMLPVFEETLATRAIPEFQRALVDTTPPLAQVAMDEVASRHGDAWPRDVEVHGVLWRTMVDPVGGVSEDTRRTLPVVDPVMDNEPEQEKYLELARLQRNQLAHIYLRHWNNDLLYAFDSVGKMSQFSNLWRIFTCGQLERLLNVEYRETNLPFVIRDTPEHIHAPNPHLLRDFMFVGVVYRQQISDRIPGVFGNPIPTDTQAYAQIMIYVPRRRLIRLWLEEEAEADDSEQNQGGVPGETVSLPAAARTCGQEPEVTDDDPEGEEPDDDDESDPWYVVRQDYGRYPTRWDLLTQNWSLQLVPATAPTIPRILSTSPDAAGVTGIDVPDLTALSEEEFLWISNH